MKQHKCSIYILFNFSLRGLKSLPITKFLQHSSCQMYVLRSLSCRKMREINKFTMLLHGYSIACQELASFALPIYLWSVFIKGIKPQQYMPRCPRSSLFILSLLFTFMIFQLLLKPFFNSLWSSSIVCIFSVRIRFTIYYLSEFTHMKMTNKFKQ